MHRDWSSWLRSVSGVQDVVPFLQSRDRKHPTLHEQTFQWESDCWSLYWNWRHYYWRATQSQNPGYSRAHPRRDSSSNPSEGMQSDPIRPKRRAVCATLRARLQLPVQPANQLKAEVWLSCCTVGWKAHTIDTLSGSPLCKSTSQPTVGGIMFQTLAAMTPATPAPPTWLDFGYAQMFLA